MNPTLKYLRRDMLRLRKKAGLSQQELSDLAGEPCRTFIAHLEQGRRQQVNIDKLYAHLHVLITATNEAHIKRKRRA